MKQDFFRDSGGYLYHIELRGTADQHSRAIFVDGKELGLLLFHDWKFLIEPTVPRLDLRVMSRIMAAINKDSSIHYQKTVDDRVIMSRNARTALTEQGVDHQNLSDKEAVELYLSRPAI